MAELVSQLVYLLGLMLATVLVWRQGQRDDRLGLGVLVAASLASFPATMGSSWHQPNVALTLVDGAYLAALVTLAMTSRRFWPMYAAGWQLVGVLTHLAKFLDGDIVPRAYAYGSVLWGYLILAALIWEVHRFPAERRAPRSRLRRSAL